MNSVPSVFPMQRRLLLLTHLIFEDCKAINGSGAAIAVSNRLASSAVTIRDVRFYRNHAFSGSGGALSIDSSNVDLTSVYFINNSASTVMDKLNITDATPANATFVVRQAIAGLCNNTNCTCNNTSCTDSVRRSTSSAAEAIEEKDELLPLPEVSVNMNGNGGAVSIYATSFGSVVNVAGTTMRGNTATNAGGALFVLGSKLFINPKQSSTEMVVLLYNNTAMIGGNVYLESSSLLATKVTGADHLVIRNGRASDFGGGVACVGSTINMHATLIADNVAGMDGGGLYGVLCLMSAIKSSFFRNKAGDAGGALYFQSISNIALKKVIISDNKAGGAGGGITAIRAREFFMTDSQVLRNTGAEGGGLNLDNTLSQPVMQNVKIQNNEAKSGGGGGILWIHQIPLLIQTELKEGIHKRIVDEQKVHDTFFGPNNKAQYGKAIASGITTVTISLQDEQSFHNTIPFDPVIEVQVLGKSSFYFLLLLSMLSHFFIHFFFLLNTYFLFFF